MCRPQIARVRIALALAPRLATGAGGVAADPRRPRRRSPPARPGPRPSAPSSSGSATRSAATVDSIGLLAPRAADDRAGQGRPQQRAQPPQARLPLAPPRRARRAVALRRRRVRIPVGHRPPARPGPTRGTAWAWPSTASATRRSPSSPASRPCWARTRSPGRRWRSPSRPRWTRRSSAGLVELANTALRQRVNIKLGVALDALRRSATTAGAQDPEVLLARGRVEREVGDGDSALAAFQGYLERGREPGPGPARDRPHAVPARAVRRSAARTTRARPRTTRPRSRATGPISRPSPPTACCVSSTSSRRAAGGLSASEFWTERDRAELRADGERLREHYRRLFYARKNFQLTALNRHYDIVERYRSGSRDFDDRGDHLHPPRRAHQPRHLRRARARAQRVVALQPARRRPDLPLRRAGGRAGLQAGREPVRRARIQQRRRAAGRPSADRTTRSPSSSCSRASSSSPIYRRLQAAGRRRAPGSTRPRSARMGQESIARRHHDRQLRAALPRGAQGPHRGAGRRTGLDRDRRCRSPTRSPGPGLEPVHGDPRLPLLGPGPLRRPSTDRARSWPRWIPRATSWRRRRCPTSEHLVGRVARAGAAGHATTTGSPFSRARTPGVVLPRDYGAGRSADARPRLGPQRSGARQPEHQSVLAPHRRGHRRSSTRSGPSSASEEMQLYYEVEGVAAGEHVRGAARGAEAGWERRPVQEDLRRRSAQPSASSSTPGRGVPDRAATHRGLQLDKLKPGILRAGGGRWRTQQGRRDQRAQAFQVVDDKKYAETASNDEAALRLTATAARPPDAGGSGPAAAAPAFPP